jgi:hypothetical protein
MLIRRVLAAVDASRREMFIAPETRVLMLRGMVLAHDHH